MSAHTAENDRPLTPCGMRVCTGCATCIKAWAKVARPDLEPWQVALVDRVFPAASRDIPPVVGKS